MAEHHKDDMPWPIRGSEDESAGLDSGSGKHEIPEAAKLKCGELYRKYVNIFEFATNGYLIVDFTDLIQELNLAASISLNAPRSKLIGRRITDFIHRDDRDEFSRQRVKCHDSNGIMTFELKMKKEGGGFFNARLQIQPIFDKFEKERQFTVSLTDISEEIHFSTSHALLQDCLNLASTAHDIQALLAGNVKLIKGYLGCDAVGIRLRDESDNIPYKAYDGFSQAFYETESPLCLDTATCMCTAVIKGTTDPCQPFFTPKGSFYVNGISRFMAAMPAEILAATRNACHAHGYESVALIPIPGEKRVEGLIHAADHLENRFPLRMVEALELAGTRLGLALQRYFLNERLRDSLMTLNDLSRHLLRAQEDEQRRIAMELHDGCGQNLNVLKLQLKRLKDRLPGNTIDLSEDFDHLLTHTDRIIEEVRTIAHGLKPSALETLGLVPATRQMLREYAALHKIQIEKNIDLLGEIKDPTTQVCLYRIFQEALTNVLKHAQATWVLFRVKREGEYLQISIKDNGIGFDDRQPIDRPNGENGMGLAAMALRCRMINAIMTLDSQPSKGTRLMIRVPSPKKEVPLE